MTRPRILLADDHRLLIEAFRKLLEPECEVVGTVGDGRALIELAPTLAPDVIILDIAMPLLNGLEAAQQLKHLLPRVKLIVVTMNGDPDVAAEALRCGASGYLLKNSASTELFRAIQDVLRGVTYITPLLGSEELRHDIRRGRHREAPDLTPRQREVLQLLAEGHSMKQVAGILQLTPRTVAFHKYRIMKQLRLRTNAELVQYAIRQSIVFPR